MIKLEKVLNEIPVSLVPAYIDLFPGQLSVPMKSRTTHEKRLSVINSGAYNDTSSFNDRYKLSDIRSRLISIYRGKCAFCEQKVEQYHVEHYRPKAIYYWLAFSWDNLMLSCPTCNQNKGVNFELEGTTVTFNNTEANLRSINNSSANYDLVELPKMVNPEITDPSGEIRFQVNGIIESDNVRFAYTIEKCKIDRKDLNDNRRSLLDRFREHLRDVALSYDNNQDKKIGIETTIRNFIIDSKNSEIEFLAFRRYAISSGWLNDIAKDIN